MWRLYTVDWTLVFAGAYACILVAIALFAPDWVRENIGLISVVCTIAPILTILFCWGWCKLFHDHGSVSERSSSSS